MYNFYYGSCTAKEVSLLVNDVFIREGTISVMDRLCMTTAARDSLQFNDSWKSQGLQSRSFKH